MSRRATCGGLNKDGATTRRILVVAALIIFCASVGDTWAYTYTYVNRTGYLVKVAVQLYDDVDKASQIKTNESYTISSKSLLKSWTAEVFLDNSWQQTLHMTCDLLPGNQTFSIYVEEVKDARGIITRTWNALNK